MAKTTDTTVDDAAGTSDDATTDARGGGLEAGIIAAAEASPTPTSHEDQKFIVYGEYKEIPDGQGGVALLDVDYPEPKIVDEIAPYQRGNALPKESADAADAPQD